MMKLGMVAITLMVVAMNVADRRDQQEMHAAAEKCREKLGRSGMLLVRDQRGYICASPRFFIPSEQVRQQIKATHMPDRIPQ
ncbi:hypothetical protein OSS47_28350 [Pseudomonas citronellolis]|uniref:hypothetical protein n=1 Tax=Pseudomonas citronellolis TaxID=53408 RepID=UPI00227096C7|nr:hypothetical protein [Pseudomonas citronellolis]WAB91981.1 hypothetical protein OSS47_28350 [Pseudomonas citronellolis]